VGKYPVWHRDQKALTSGDGSDDEEGFGTGRDGVRQWRVRRLVREVFFAREESQERPTLSRSVVADGPAQHGIAGFKGVEHGALRDRGLDLDLHLAADMRQSSQMLREYDSDHGSVCTSTDSTPGKSRTIGAQLSPASADA